MACGTYPRYGVNSVILSKSLFYIIQYDKVLEKIKGVPLCTTRVSVEEKREVRVLSLYCVFTNTQSLLKIV